MSVWDDGAWRHGAGVSDDNTRQFLAVGFLGVAVFIALCVATLVS
ncbi:hypothetical protein [Rhodopseudomonas sp. B29]|nr:hypothetical protein [Rhodopseudomonas sp. B29]